MSWCNIIRNGVREIEIFFEKLKLAWDRGDGEAYGACFTEDADYVTFQGDHLQGRRAIADTHQELWNSVLRGSTLEGEIKKIHFITPELAIFHGLGAVKLKWQKTAPKKRDSINTNVAIKQNGEWKIAAFQNSRISGPSLMQKIFMKVSTNNPFSF
ncbi:SgcJ/EcaC family oxidoreductase [Paenibacillus sp. UNC451MF]|uniref:SgcJ/EcaC family oxidoreductase n=1 Tax=Paenibacillus sp. UNC451MF TaxID=1449063 RepID=UPI0007E8E3DA|nr:SgcJ/EcaC family oxidoreductase [Paenibacillus sp. UNC451MF]